MKMKRFFLSWVAMAMCAVCSTAWAHDIEVKNAEGVTIYYNYINKGKELEVANSYYTGHVIIPEEVTYLDKTLKVTAIGGNAFYENIELMSIVIPNTVTSIGSGAFLHCI